MDDDKETFVSTEEGCKVKHDREGNIYMENCKDIQLNIPEIDFIHRINKKKYFIED